MIDSEAAGNKLFNSDVTMSGCPDTSAAQPSGVIGPSPRKALPPGTYQLVAAMEDAHAGTNGILVSEPATIQVTAG